MGTPAVSQTADPTAPDGRLIAACDAAQRLHVVLEDLIQHRDTRHDDTGRSATVVHASLPWNSRVAYLVFDLAQLARGLEANLHLLISGTVPERGGSDRNTHLALQALPNLAIAVDREVASLVSSQLEGWCNQARIAIGEVEPPARIPRLPGHSEPRCPWCQRQSLRLQVYAGLVRCVNPLCYDDLGYRPVAHAELNDGIVVLRWQDGDFHVWGN